MRWLLKLFDTFSLFKSKNISNWSNIIINDGEYFWPLLLLLVLVSIFLSFLHVDNCEGGTNTMMKKEKHKCSFQKLFSKLWNVVGQLTRKNIAKMLIPIYNAHIHDWFSACHHRVVRTIKRGTMCRLHTRSGTFATKSPWNPSTNNAATWIKRTNTWKYTTKW